MSQPRISSPARSQGAVTPRRYKSRRTQSVGSPARSTASGRLSSMIRVKETDKDSFVLSPAPTRRSVLNDDTYIEEPRRKSWWKKLSDNSRDVMEALKDNKILEINEAVEEFIDIEVLSQEKKNYTIDLPESSDSESVSSIVIPQRKLFTQKDVQAEDKFGQLMGPRETLTKLQKSMAHEKTINVAPKNLFNQPSKPRSRPMFPAGLLNISLNKTANKTKEITITEKAPTRNLFGNRQVSKRKNMFQDFIMSDSEDEISEIQPKIFGFRNTDHQQNVNLQQRDPSPTSSITADIEMDDWKLLPSSTMVENQLEDILEPKEPVEKTQLRMLSESPETNKEGANKSIDRTKSKQLRKSEINNSKTLVKSHTNLENSTSNKNKSKLLATEEESTKSMRKSRTNKSQIEGSLSGTTSYTEQVETSAKRPRLSSSPTPKLTPEEDQNRSLNLSNKTVIESSIMTRSKTNNLSKNLNTSNTETKRPEPEQTNKESSSEDDELNMSLVYDEHDEIDAIKSSQEEFDLKNRDKSEKGITNKSKEDIQDDGEVVNSVEELGANSGVNADNQIQTINKAITDEEPDSGHINNEHEHSKKDNQDNTNKSIQDTNEENKKQKEDFEVNEEAEVEAEPEVSKEELEADNEKLETEEKRHSIEKKEQRDEEENINAEQEIDKVNKEDEEEHEIDEENQEVDKEIEEHDQEIEEQDQEIEEQDQKIEEQDREIEEQDQEVEEEMHSEEENEHYNEIKIQNDEEEQEIDEENKADDEEEQEMDVEHEDQEIDDEIQEEDQDEEEESQEVEQNNLEEEEIEESQEEPEIEESQEEAEMEESQEEAEINESQEENEISQEEQEIEEEEAEDVQDNHDDEQDDSQELDESNREIDEEDNVEVHNESSEEIQDTNEENEEETPNVSHDTTGRQRKKNETKLNSPEVILHDKTKQMESFTAKGRNTSLRRTSIMKNMNIRTSLAPPRDSTGFSDGKDSSAEGSGWDSHRTTRKTLRQTFGKDFTPRKSLRALVMEKSAKRQTAVNETAMTSKYPQANSTELPETTNFNDDTDNLNVTEANHDVSKRTRQTTLEMYLQKIKKQNQERRLKIEENVKNSLKAPMKDISNMFKVPSKPMFSSKKSNFKAQRKPKAKQIKANLIPLDDLPAEVIEDMKYKPPKRYQPSNAAWITKSLYKFLETKLEPKYDYKARVRAEKLVEEIYQFAKELRRHPASAAAVDALKLEMARLQVVTTHFDFYQFFHDYMPREIRVKVVPDVMNKLPMPRHGVFTEILRANTVQGQG